MNETELNEWRTTPTPVIDLFAGPGGWDIAAESLGLESLGFEFDAAACKTRAAAGLRTIPGDLSQLEPTDFETPAPLGFIASPPCQAFSMAGTGAGRRAMGTYIETIRAMGQGKTPDADALAQACDDERAHLVLEPLRWVLALMPEWIACEQVEPVLPIWGEYADVLRALGYSVWYGVLRAEQYGVPQTRKRAILLASRSREVAHPRPTHRRFVAPREKAHDKQEESLFDPGDRETIVHPHDRDLLPWISMAEALGWREGVSVLSTFGEPGDRGDGTKKEPYPADDRPASTIDTMVGSWRLRAAGRENAAVRSQDEPAPTIIGGNDTSNRVWEPVGQLRDSGPAAARDPRSIDDPSFTIRSAGSGSNQSGVKWVGDESRRVTQTEAAILQSFPADYPWQGAKSKQFQQIGNAIPPLLARAALAEVIGQK